MFKKIAIAMLVAGAALGSANAATMSDDMKGFFTGEGMMKSEGDVTTMYGGMSDAKKAAMKEECKANAGSVGISEAQKQFCNWLAKMK